MSGRDLLGSLRKQTGRELQRSGPGSEKFRPGYEGIYRYTINTDTIANLMTTDNSKIKKSKNLNLLLDAYSFQLKITMERPKNVPNPENSTPVVYQYKLIVETGGENIEY